MKKLTILAAVMLVITACKKDATRPPAEEEHDAINSVTLIFRQGGTVVSRFVAEDPDGDGGNEPTRLDTIKLAPNQAYTMEIEIRNITNSGSTDITESIEEEAADHELYFLPVGLALTITKTDLDENNLPIGLRSEWQTSSQGTGHVTVLLKHKPGIKAAGDLHTKGATDLELAFPVKVQ
jgi:hypothetical protein